MFQPFTRAAVVFEANSPFRTKEVSLLVTTKYPLPSSITKSLADPGWLNPGMKVVYCPVAVSSLLILATLEPIAVASWLAGRPPGTLRGDEPRVQALVGTNLPPEAL